MTEQQYKVESWVKDIINSCKTVDQTRTAENLVQLYAAKYDLVLPQWLYLLSIIDNKKLELKR